MFEDDNVVKDTRSGDRNVNGNGKVPISVLDKFVELSRENNDAYGAMVDAVETMSGNLINVSNSLETLEKQIADENLAQVMKTCSNTIRGDVEAIRKATSTCARLDYNILVALGNYLEYNNVDTKHVSETLVKFVNFIGFFQKNALKIMFVMGVVLAFILGTNGITAWDILKTMSGAK
jgi:hypothetical protein